MTAPTYLSVTTILTVAMGSKPWAMIAGSGKSLAELKIFSEPFLSLTLYSTEGETAITGRPNSRSKRSPTTSEWSSPKKPTFTPWPRMGELIPCVVRAESLSLSFSRASTRSRYWEPSAGYISKKTLGWILRNPGKGVTSLLWMARQRVSPTKMRWISLSPVMM